MTRIPDSLTFSTVRIECETEGGTSVGTGFFYSFDTEDDRSIPTIITNRHVIAGAKIGRFQLTRSAEKMWMPAIRKVFTFDVDDFESKWTPHPDPNVDLCVLPMGPTMNQLTAQGRPFYFTHLDKTVIPTPEELRHISAGEEIVMVGYPIGLWDSANNMPIFRRGIAATHPFIDYEGRREFIIDAACFPGSSGSPVLCDLGARTVPLAGRGPQFRLLGILYAGAEYAETGRIEIHPIPTQTGQVARTLIPANLGFVIKSEVILEFEPALQAMAGEDPGGGPPSV